MSTYPAQPTASGSSQQATLLPTAANSPGNLFSFDDLVDMDVGGDGVQLFDPQFELPDSWGFEGVEGVGMPGEYEDFNPIPPPSFSPLPFTLPETANPQDLFHPPHHPPPPNSDQLTTSLFSTFESSALSSFLTSTLGEPQPPQLPPVPPAAQASSSSFKRSSASVFAGLVKARGAWDFNPALPAGLPSWRKVGEGVHGVPGLRGLERMRISNEEAAISRGRHPGEIGAASGALVGWPAVTPADLQRRSSSQGSHTPTAGQAGRTSAGTRRPSFSSNGLPTGSTQRRPPSTARKRSVQPQPPSSNTSGSTPSASTPTTLPDQDTLMSEPRTGAPEDGFDGLRNRDDLMGGLVRVAQEEEDEEDELEEDEMSDGSGAYDKGRGKGKGKRPARSAPTPTPPPSASTRTSRAGQTYQNPSLPPPHPTSSTPSSSRSNAKRPKHGNSSTASALPPPPQPTLPRPGPPPPQAAPSHSQFPTPLPNPPPPPRANRQASIASASSSSTTTNGTGVKAEDDKSAVAGGASFGRGLLTAKEKRENHIMSEQKRRNAIRNSYTDLSLILTSSTLVPLPPLPSSLPPPPPSSGTPKQKQKAAKAEAAAGRGGSKSSVLGKAVGLVKWLEEGNEWLERECERLAGLMGEDGEEEEEEEMRGVGGVKMES